MSRLRRVAAGRSSHTLRRLLTGEIAVRRAAGVLGEGPLRVLVPRRDPANLREAVGAEIARLHRTGLHYRLARIEELTGRSLKNGTHRLELHLALKLIRWNTV
jgi:PucR C-terminal helix-turn-helix domain